MAHSEVAVNVSGETTTTTTTSSPITLVLEQVSEVSTSSSTTIVSLADSHPTSSNVRQESVTSEQQHHHHQNYPPRRVAANGSHPRRHGSYDHRLVGKRNDQRHGQNPRDSLHPPFFNPFVPLPPLHPNMPPIMPLGASFVPFFPILPPRQFELSMQIMNQINYYFSNENLVKDLYLRKKMDTNGWVHVDIISSFCLVKKLTNNKYHILDAIRLSALVEAQGNKMRRRHDWKRWILPPSIQLPPI